MTVLNDEFLSSIAKLSEPYPRIKWHISILVGLAAMNYCEEIPGTYTKLLTDYFLEDQKTDRTREIREALTKVCGIHGAAKTGNSLRALAEAVPPELRDPVCYREEDSSEVAIARGKIFARKIYGPNKAYDPTKTVDASPDYSYIVRNFFYGHIFSFDGILGFLETEQAVISCLIGIDCQEQVGNHMKGMLYNGATREEVNLIRQIAIRLADKLGVTFKTGPVSVPEI